METWVEYRWWSWKASTSANDRTGDRNNNALENIKTISYLNRIQDRGLIKRKLESVFLVTNASTSSNKAKSKPSSKSKEYHKREQSYRDKSIFFTETLTDLFDLVSSKEGYGIKKKRHHVIPH